MGQLREVNLTKNYANKIKTKKEVRSYEESKKEQIAYINAITDLLKEHNEKITPIVENYKRRTGQV